MNIHEGNNSHIFFSSDRKVRHSSATKNDNKFRKKKNRKVNENKNEILQTAADFHWKVFRIFVVVFRLKRNKILGLNSSPVAQRQLSSTSVHLTKIKKSDLRPKNGRSFTPRFQLTATLLVGNYLTFACQQIIQKFS